MRKYALLLVFAWVAGALPGSTPASAQAVNGGFETGDLTGWAYIGNGSAQVLTSVQISPLTPTEGNYFALLGDGPGDAGSDGLPDQEELTSAAFTVSADGARIQYDLDFLTAEFTGPLADPARLDFYSVDLLQQGGGRAVLERGDVSQAGFTPIDSGNVVSAPDGTSVLDHLGIRPASFVVAAGTYSLRFSISDAGDGSFDSALLLDNVRLTPLATAPEPGATLTLTVGAVLLVVWTAARCGAQRQRER